MPRYDDAVVQDIQKDFVAKIDWLQRVYAIARVGVDSMSKETYPQIQANNATRASYNIRPDNKCAAYCFFEVEQPYEINYNTKEVKYYLSVVFWGDLSLIDNTKGYDFTGVLIQEVIQRLERRQCGDIKVEENPEKIFYKYSAMKQYATQHMMRRYTSFKIYFTTTTGYEDSCI
jgi:hypothetical protein